MNLVIYGLTVLSLSLAQLAYPLSQNARPVVGEKEDSSVITNAPGGPVPRNEKEPDLSGRGLPRGEEVYGVMEIRVNEKGEKVLVPVEAPPEHKK
ncbi:MAG: hypothetical protein R3A80_12900 [Bdellovibrionota bacterium]